MEEQQLCNSDTEKPWHLAIGETLTCTNNLDFPKSWSAEASNLSKFFFNSCDECCRQMFPRNSLAEEYNCSDVCDSGASVGIPDDADADGVVSQFFIILFLSAVAFVVVVAVMIGRRIGLIRHHWFGVLLWPALVVWVLLFCFFISLQLNSVNFMIAKTRHVATIEDTFRQEQKYRYSHHQVQERCEALKMHQMGRWRHYFFVNNTDSLNDEMRNRIRNLYSPLELEWLAGNSSSWKGQSKFGGCAQYRDTHGLMFTATLGNQCGCASNAFRPSHSVWVNELHPPPDGGADVLQSPSFRLVERLAGENRSLCFMGDSVDNQFYDALRYNLERILLIKSNYSSFIQIQAEQIPLNYTTETGPSPYSEGASRYASHMKRTIVSLGENLKATFKYMKHYGWAPGDTSFLDDCDIVVTNLGLHYSPYSEKLMNGYKSDTPIPNLGASVLASVTYLADLASLDDKISIWRSALPQHFDTPEGHYPEFKSSWDGHVCTTLKSAKNYLRYNRIYKDKFLELKPINQSSEERVCDAYESKVRVNRTSLALPTVYRYYLEKNCCKKRLERLERLRDQGDDNVTGTVLRWEIADLFDVPFWHSSDRDCTHFCYIPALFEAAFERLDLLIPPL